MSELRNELERLSLEVRELSKEIGALKRKLNETTLKADRLEFESKIKRKQYQALFYIDKIENLKKKLDIPSRTMLLVDNSFNICVFLRR